MAIRLSLGANRGQLIGQLLTESVVLAVIGGLAGLLVARWTLDVIFAMLPNEAAETLQVRIDGTVLLFAAARDDRHRPPVRSVPGLAQHRSEPARHAQGAGRPARRRQVGASGSAPRSPPRRSRSRWRCWCAPACSPRACMNVSRVELGINVEHLATFGVSPELNGYTAERSKQLFERLEDELAAQPGVTGVTASMVPALSGSNWGSSVAVEGFKAGPDTDNNSRYNEVGARLLQDDGHPAARRPRVHARATPWAGPRWRSSTRRSRRSSTSETTPSASAWATAAPTTSSTSRSSASRQGREVQRGQGRDSAAVLPALSSGRPGRLAVLLRPDRRRARADHPDHPAPGRDGRSEPAGREPADDGAAGAGQRRSSIG